MNHQETGRRPADNWPGEPAPVIRRAALTIAALSAFLTPFMGSAVQIAMPAIETDFKIGAVILSWVANAYLLAAAMALVPAGRAADIYGRRRVFITGNLTFTVASLLCAAAPDVRWLIVARVIQGVGSAMLFATGIAIVTAVYPAHRRGTVLGVNVAAVYVGPFLRPFRRRSAHRLDRLAWRLLVRGAPGGAGRLLHLAPPAR